MRYCKGGEAQTRDESEPDPELAKWLRDQFRDDIDDFNSSAVDSGTGQDARNYDTKQSQDGFLPNP
jgi:hypothetical protein